jgi:putative peptidoglycan lipid II flippase
VSEGRSADGWKLFSNIATLTACVLLVSIGLCWWFTPELVAVMYPSFSASQQATTSLLTRIILPGPLFFFIGGLLTATETVRGSFAAASLTPLVYNLAIISGGLFLAPWLGVAGFSWGVLAGAALGALLVPLAFAWSRVRFRPRLDLADPELRGYLLATAPLLIGVSLLTVDEWMVRYFGATLGVGAITHLSNARKLMLVPASLIGQSVSYAILPSLSNDLAAGRVDEANERMSSSIRSIVALAALSAIALASVAEPVVRSIYQHGAFAAADATATASYLRILALGVPGWCLATVASRGFYARQENGRAMVITSAITLLSLPVYGLGAGHGAGVGLAWASVAGCTLQGIAIAAALDRRHKTQTVVMTLRGLADGMLFAAPAAALVFAWSGWGSERLALQHPWDAALALGIGAVAFGLSTVAYVWRAEPVLFAKVSARLRRGRRKLR